MSLSVLLFFWSDLSTKSVVALSLCQLSSKSRRYTVTFLHRNEIFGWLTFQFQSFKLWLVLTETLGNRHLEWLRVLCCLPDFVCFLPNQALALVHLSSSHLMERPSTPRMPLNLLAKLLLVFHQNRCLSWWNRWRWEEASDYKQTNLHQLFKESMDMIPWA